MRITFVGDVAIPQGIQPVIRGAPPHVFENTIANLEGPIMSGTAIWRARSYRGPVRLYNADIALDVLMRLNTRAVSLANNHIFDWGNLVAETRHALREKGIAACGAGQSLAEAAQPAKIQVGPCEVVVLSFGWEMVRCIAASEHRYGVNPLRPELVLAAVAHARNANPASRIVLVLHWNYELEPYPQPMHRQLAFAAIDMGADAVVGHHPHCIGGLELYKGAPIVYSLGNWFIPHGRHFGSPLSYPPIVQRQLAVQWDPKCGRIQCHWFNFDPGSNRIDFIATEAHDCSDTVRQLTPFAGCSHREYVRWFKGNRMRRKGLPIYENYDDVLGNRLRDAWLRGRDHAVKARSLLQRIRAR